ncbi:DUF4279 domain-containing protein [Janthinobacterium sp. MP5059B]|uniref:DUF4279 domain-containing protein n=1 Tax=Janthinobacterium sp. MP5059B TaxID=1766683 RepID=UPI001585EC19|nr:DUF4279 domain-containing protein [Janthinobacterium sp. MP5059B]
MKIDVSVYLRGDSLDPVTVSSLLGIEPSKSRRKGECWTTSSNREVTAKIGIWAIVADANSSGLQAVVDEVTTRFRDNRINLSEINGVEEAYVDVFVAIDAEADGGGTCNFQLSKENVSALNSLGLPVRFTVSVIKS